MVRRMSRTLPLHNSKTKIQALTFFTLAQLCKLPQFFHSGLLAITLLLVPCLLDEKYPQFLILFNPQTWSCFQCCFCDENALTASTWAASQACRAESLLHKQSWDGTEKHLCTLTLKLVSCWTLNITRHLKRTYSNLLDFSSRPSHPSE